MFFFFGLTKRTLVDVIRNTVLQSNSETVFTMGYSNKACVIYFNRWYSNIYGVCDSLVPGVAISLICPSLAWNHLL